MFVATEGQEPCNPVGGSPALRYAADSLTGPLLTVRPFTPDIRDSLCPVNSPNIGCGAA
jgi:hypothetical protein